MRASEVIEKLNELIKIYGDLSVGIHDDGSKYFFPSCRIEIKDREDAIDARLYPKFIGID